MSLVPAFELGLWNGWWFSAVYVLAHLILIPFYPREALQRFFIPPDLSRAGKVRNSISSLLWYGITLYAVFVPIKPGGWPFWAGLALFILGMIGYEVSVIVYAKTPVDKPVVGGPFRVSRNPIYVANFFLWCGVGLATASWVILVANALEMLLIHFYILAEERFCLETYGESYREYAKRVPRYFNLSKGLRG
ncbi:isoprenylcysteine carboxylmethyltransferase family protein [bacterium]|nr:isoprenylcysteine carboxylmethyltransferase family protein [bacterium]